MDVQGRTSAGEARATARSFCQRSHVVAQKRGSMSSSSSSAFWAYLPAFIAVAETQHLRKAAQAIHVSPSALSRTIAMLEYRIGYSLFERSGRRLRLTPRGERLLRALRRSMTLLEETLMAAHAAPLEAAHAHMLNTSAVG